MHPIRKQRLLVVIMVMCCAALAIGLMVYALRENMNLFFSPKDVLAGKAPLHQQIRVGGYVVKDSLQRSGTGLDLQFRLTDGEAKMTVHYSGILPDLFTEGEAAIAKGKLTSATVFMATEVLAKHDENYTPPEVSDTAKKPEYIKP